MYGFDGVRAWLVCCAAFLSNLLTFGCTMTYGLMFPVLLDEFKQGKAKTAWVGSLGYSLSMACAPLAAKLIERFGARLVAVGGGLATALGLVITSQPNTLDLMYLTYSVPIGIGSCCEFNACLAIVPQYFKKRLSLATGIMLAGAGMSLVAMSPVVEILLSVLDWRRVFLSMGGIACIVPCLAVCFFAANTDDISQRTHLPNGQRNMSEDGIEQIPVWKNVDLIIISCACMVYHFGNIIPLMHMGKYSRDLHLSADKSAKLYIGFGLGSTCGRVISGWICDVRIVNPLYVSAASVLTAGISTILCPFATGFPALMLYMCVDGFADGFYINSSAVLVIRWAGQQHARAFGMVFFFTSLGYAAGPPFGGFLADYLGTYVPVFYVAGSCSVSSAVILILLKCRTFKTQESERRERVTVKKELLEVSENVTSL